MKKIIIITIVFIAMMLGLFFYFKIADTSNRYRFKIYFFNAGKADAIVLSKNNKYIMIDTGEESLNEEILKYFKSNNIKKLDYLIITHFDKDHVGSASKIIDSIEIKNVLQSNVPKNSEYYDNYINSLERKGITPITVSGDYEISLADLEIIVNGPDKVYNNNSSNNSSLIISIKDDVNKFLFMGDAENGRLKDFLNINNETYDFIKVPYHGKYLKRLENLIKNKNIKYAVITSSNDEPAADETIDLINKYDIEYYLTSNGNITILSDGTNIKIKQ